MDLQYEQINIFLNKVSDVVGGMCSDKIFKKQWKKV